MGLSEDLAKEHAEFDPHGLKTGFADTPLTSHVNEPYEHQAFPKVLYKTEGKGVINLIAKDQEAQDKAIAEGWSESPSAPVAPEEAALKEIGTAWTPDPPKNA